MFPSSPAYLFFVLLLLGHTAPNFPTLSALWLDELWASSLSLSWMVLSCMVCSVCSPKIDSTPFSACSVPWAAPPPPTPHASLTRGIQLSYYPDQEGCRWEHREVGIFPLLPHCSGHHSTISACTRQSLLSSARARADGTGDRHARLHSGVCCFFRYFCKAHLFRKSGSISLTPASNLF